MRMSVGIGPFRFYSGAFAAIGGLVAAGMLIQYWQVFAFVALGIVVLHCLVRKPKAQPLTYSCTIEELRERLAQARRN
jgi:hypothetical protein